MLAQSKGIFKSGPARTELARDALEFEDVRGLTKKKKEEDICKVEVLRVSHPQDGEGGKKW